MSDRKSDVAVVLLVSAFALAGIARLWQLSEITSPIDFLSFYATSRLAESAGFSFYPLKTHRTLLVQWQAPHARPASKREAAATSYWNDFATSGSPFFYATLRLITAGPFERAYQRWRVVAILALAASLGVLGYEAGASAALVVTLLAWVAVVFRPTAEDVRVANLNLLLLLMIAGWVALIAGPAPWRQFASGVVLAALIAWKPLLLYVPVFTVLGAWRDRAAERGPQARLLRWTVATAPLGQLSGLAAGTALAFMVGAVYLGSAKAWGTWLHGLGHPPSAVVALEIGNVSLVHSLLGHTPSWLPAVAIAAAAAPIAFRKLRRRDERRGVAAMRRSGLGIVLFYLISPLVWPHYLLLVVPLVLALLASGRANVSSQWSALVIVGLALTGFLELEFGWRVTMEQAAWQVAFGLATLFAIALFEELA